MDYTTLSGEDLTKALAIDFTATDEAGLTAALSERKTAATALFALDAPTIAQVDDAEALVASVASVEGEIAARAAKAEEAGKRFAAARATFADDSSDTDDEGDDADKDKKKAPAFSEGEGDGDADADAESEDADAEGDEDADAEGDAEGEGDDVVTAAVDHSKSQRVKIPAKESSARKVAAGTKRPARKASTQVVITAAANVPNVTAGSVMTGMEDVTTAALGTVKNFPPFNERAAQMNFDTNGGEPMLNKTPLAMFGIDFKPEHRPSKEVDEYAAVKASLRDHQRTLEASMGDHGAQAALTAAGFCAPSENVYSWIADYVVDGLLTLPEVSAPRGGLNITLGPQVTTQGSDIDNFGWSFTEAQMISGVSKPCETITCPPFVDHRLDAIGYCWKIPFLTQKAYPEVITDALRLADARYAHRLNKRYISDLLAGSSSVALEGYGPSFTDTLEYLSIVAVKERRRWNLGENAILEVKLPVWVKEVFRADMSRRSAVAFDSVGDAQIMQHFTDRRLAVEWLADWAELGGPDAILPGTFPVMMYPSGTWVKALEDIVNLSAVYDAASLSANEYTGVFFEQATMTVKVGYRSIKGSIPINTAGEMGALTLSGLGDSIEGNGSF